MFDNDEENPQKCTCQDCGKTFNKGEEGDNEKFCLRCEHLEITYREYPLSEDFWDRHY